MHLNIAHKIFGIALVVLALMIAVAIFSVRFTARISNELDLVAGKQLPLSDSIGRINVHLLEHALHLQHLFALTEEAPDAVARVRAADDAINEELEKDAALLAEEEEGKHAPGTVKRLRDALLRVERNFRIYEAKGIKLLALHEQGDRVSFAEMLPDFVRLQNAVDHEISALRKHMDAVADGAVKRADSNEKSLLITNIALTALSAVLGLGIAAFVTYILVRNVRNLVRGAKRVGEGDLDAFVPVVTKDEVGQLTNSFNLMVGDLRLKERIKDTFGKYMDPRIVTRLIENPEMTQLGGERNEMTIMFIDLQGYTSISEKLPPSDLVKLLNMFLAHMTEAVAHHQGVINDFQGDAVMAYWGPPFTSEDEHALLACRAALMAVENFERYQEEVVAELGPKAEGLEIAMRVGISTGIVVSGNIGSAASRKYSVIGDPVNLGSRLEGVNKSYGTRIILSERTRVLAGDDINVRELDLIRVKGKREPTRIYELLPAPVSADRFVDGLTAYRRQEWATARAAFESCRDLNPRDPVPAVFLDRVAQLSADPPGSGWDGVWEFQTK